MRARVVLAVVVALAAAELPARGATSPTRAKAHYEKAQQLYATGSYDEAIAEYQEAYRLKPHPNVLYNIAQAYERLLDYAQSVVWFERYLAEAPQDAAERPIVENRLRILRNLPARISVTTIPEHVHAAIVDAAGKRQEAETPTVFKMPAGGYTIELAQPGWEAESHDVAVELGQPYFYQYRLKRSTAQVSIFTRPRGARVFIDERLVGETPFAGTLDVGRHKLLLEHRDYPWHREDLDVKAGAPIQREVTLTRPIRSGRTELVIGVDGLRRRRRGRCWWRRSLDDSSFGNSGPALAVYSCRRRAGIGAGFLGSFLSTRDGIKVGYSSLMIGGAVWGTSFATGAGARPRASDQLRLRPRHRRQRHRHDRRLPHRAQARHLRRRRRARQLRRHLGHGDGRAVGAVDLPQPVGVAVRLVHARRHDARACSPARSLAWKLELSRGHVGLIDVGGLAGTGLGFALGYVIGVNAGAARTTSRPAPATRSAAWRSASSPAPCSRASTRATCRPSRRSCAAAATAAGPSASPRSASSRRRPRRR